MLTIFFLVCYNRGVNTGGIFMSTLIDRERFEKERFDIILLIGQSNAEGFGQGEVANPYNPSPSILQLTNTAPVFLEITPKDVPILHVEDPSSYKIEIAAETVHPQQGTLGCFALPFAKSYCEKYLSGTERKVLVIRAAVGSSGFLRGNWCLNEPLYERAVEMTELALSLNPENRLAAVLWHQGESDVIVGRRKGGYDFTYPYYMEKFAALTDDLRNRFGECPFIAGAMCREWTATIQEASDAVEKATKETIEKTSLAAFAESEGLRSNDFTVHNDDSIHFSRPALYELGQRYFELYEKLR